MRKKAIFLVDEASTYMGQTLSDCYRDSCIDTYGRAKKKECEAVATPAEADEVAE